MSDFCGIEMNEARFMGLLEKVIGVNKHLQNNPAMGLVPQEDLASNFLLEALEPYSKKNGGVLEVERVTFVEGRGNVIIKYPGTTDDICSFVGSHMDVVPADAKGWDRDPFQLIVEGDFLYGRGTTDCLGHVCMLTDLMISLAEQKPTLRQSVVVVLIANEENGSFPGVGVDQLAKEGYLDSLKNGPLFWIDAADSQPCIGTAGVVAWELKAVGKLFHSGMPHRGINSIEFAMDAISYVQNKFFATFPKHEQETVYNFHTQSTMKPTQIKCEPGSLNQLPPDCTIQGDIRLAPFYDIHKVMAQVESFVADINRDPTCLHNSALRGPHSKYTLPEASHQGRIEFKWLGSGENGVACNLQSKGYHAIMQATEAVLGSAKPYSIGGSLPLIRDLQDQGFDVQVAGYGISARYHADNEYALLSDLKNAARVVSKVIAGLNRE